MKFILSQRTLTVLISLFFLLLYVNSKDAYSTYSTFDLITQDTVLVLKRYKNDILVDFDVKNQKIIQYSYDSGCLILTDLKSSSTKVIEFLKNKSSKIVRTLIVEDEGGII